MSNFFDPRSTDPPKFAIQNQGTVQRTVGSPHLLSPITNQPAPSKTNINEESVIDQVYLHPCLYDSNAEGYKDQTTRSKAWEDIGNNLNIKAEQAKEAWEKLRRCFMNAIKRRRTKQMHPWRFEQRMSFLYHHIDPSKMLVRYDSEEQQYYSETDDKGFMDELEISSPKACVRLAEESMDMPTVMFPLESPGIKREESSDGPEQHQNRPISRLLRPRSMSGSSAEANNLNYEQRPRSNVDQLQAISDDHPEVPESSIQTRKRDIDEPCPARREMVKQRKKHPSGATGGSYIGNEESSTSSNERDDIDMFFLSMAKTTKTLSPVEQARIKLQVSQIVLNAQVASLEQFSKQ